MNSKTKHQISVIHPSQAQSSTNSLTSWLASLRGLVFWRGLAAAFGVILVTAVVCAIGVNALKPRLPDIFGWNTYAWPDWPEVIPPYGGFAAGLIDVIVLGLATAAYILARRWNTRAAFSLVGLVPFLIAALALSISIPRTAYAFIWPVLIGSLSWIVATIVGKQMRWSQDIAATLAALPLVVLLVPFIPGIVMADGMKSLEILAAIEVLLAVILPAIDGLVVRSPAKTRAPVLRSANA